MSLPQTYDFAGSGALSAIWTAITGEGTPRCQLDHGEVTSVGVDAGAYDNSNTYNNDQYAQALARTCAAASVNFVSVVVRCSTSARTYYCAGVFGTLGGSVTYEIFKRVGGTKTTLGSTGTTTVNANDLIRLEISGTTLTFKVNGSTITTRTDSGIASGQAGFFMFADTGAQSDATLDDWQGDNLSAASGGPLAPSTLTLMGVQ